MRETEWKIRQLRRLAVMLLLLMLPAMLAAQGTASVQFDRTCTDPEDGDLTSTMVWTSDLDGQLGTGGQFTAELSEGTHTITVTCGPDSDGDSATPLVITHTVAIANQPPVFGGAAGGGAGLPEDGGCTGTGCP